MNDSERLSTSSREVCGKKDIEALFIIGTVKLKTHENKTGVSPWERMAKSTLRFWSARQEN